MKKTSFFAKYNLKKDLGQFISFGIILFTTALILNIAMVLAFQTGKSYDKIFADLNTSNVDVMIPKIQDNDDLEKKISDINGVKEVEKNNAISAKAVVKEFRNADFEMNTIFYNMDNSHDMNKLDIKEELREKVDNAIYLPLYVAEFGEYKLGSEITYEIEGKKHTFTVAGIVQEMQYGNYSGGFMGAYLPENEYQRLEKSLENNRVTVYSATTKDNADSKKVIDKVNNVFDLEKVKILNSKYDNLTKESRTMVSNLIIGILIAFAFIILMVSIFLSSFRIKNTIEEDIANMGVQKALGYTSDQIIAAIVFPYTLVSIIASIMGILISGIIIPILIKVIELQAGFNVDVGLNFKSSFLTFVVICAFVAIVTYFSARKIKRIQTINAIRGIKEVKSANKNHLPIDKTKGNIQIILMLKQGIASLRQNIFVFMVVFAMTILISFGGVLYYNVIVEPDNFINSISEESPSVIVKTLEGKNEFMKEKLEDENRVKKVLKYDINSVKIGSDSIPTFICEDYGKVTNDLCYKGRNPHKANEVAIGNSVAMENDYKIGDRIKVEYNEEKVSFNIVGILQSVNYQGNLLELTEEGFKKLDYDYGMESIYVYLEDEKKTGSFVEEIKDSYDEEVTQVINYYKNVSNARVMYTQIIEAIILIIAIISIIVVFLILYVTIKSMIVNRKQELGIYKSIGYSSKQLILQMTGSFMPAVGLAAYSSAILGYVYMPSICNMIFEGIGVMKNQMQVELGIQLIFATVLVIVTLLLCTCLSSKIKKISVYSLIKE